MAESQFPDGAVVRRLWPPERPLLEAHLLRLDACDRRMRFCAPTGDDAIRRYVHAIDWMNSDVVGCFLDGELRGAAELVRMPGAAVTTAEASVSVERAVRGRGLGTALVGRLLLIARNRVVRRVEMLCLAENAMMRRIARRHGGEITHDNGQLASRIATPWPSLSSLLEEATAESTALARVGFDLTAPRPQADAAEA
ncbi:Acetyltransferase (GNAT) family protein [Limimonas halophila]|uniref:Acetyltransferase (GNAT) family protein n=1 Tax=Limimonas halophila TaxID=1082479 RepID=A0A1G7P0V2_9PROT|nr:GNAT family N-acetyltransferase [Limimonas halophila]SDF79942.1 Acetyltransferase (GNAT) family protein [Limimonas halophila]